MSESNVCINKERLEYAMEVIRLYGDKISRDFQRGILDQVIKMGMSPYEAQLAGGAYFFKVEPDVSIWQKNADPNVVIAKQATDPDDSKIWLTFKNGTQFPGEGIKKFTVFFERGRVKEIRKE